MLIKHWKNYPPIIEQLHAIRLYDFNVTLTLWISNIYNGKAKVSNSRMGKYTSVMKLK